MKTIDVTIRKDGTFEYQTSGFKGKSCSDVSKEIDRMATKVIEDTKTREYYERDLERERVRE